MAEQSVWALGNISGDGPLTRDEVLKHGTAEVLVEILKKEQPVSLKVFLFSYKRFMIEMFMLRSSSHFYGISFG